MIARLFRNRLAKIEAARGGGGQYERFLASVLADRGVYAGSPQHIEALTAFQTRSGRSEPIPHDDPAFDRLIDRHVMRVLPDEPGPNDPVL